MKNYKKTRNWFRRFLYMHNMLRNAFATYLMICDFIINFSEIASYKKVEDIKIEVTCFKSRELE